jgi:hypothetical protein
MNDQRRRPRDQIRKLEAEEEKQKRAPVKKDPNAREMACPWKRKKDRTRPSGVGASGRRTPAGNSNSNGEADSNQQRDKRKKKR